MRFKLKQFDGKYHVYSVAVTEEAAKKLEKQGLPFWKIENNGINNVHDGNQVLVKSSDLIYLQDLNDFDVLEVFPNGIVNRYYNDSSEDNLFFITEKCNSNCIMCPSPDSSRKNGDSWRADQLIHVAEYIPSDARHFTITGGEPFMIGRQIFDFLEYLKNKFMETEFLILTNGRIFAVPSYCQLLKETSPYNTILGIPIHASYAGLHDYITRVSGSFEQTVSGLKNLLSLGCNVELRIVVSRLNADNLEDLAYLVTEELPTVEHVSIMAMEMTGSAYHNRNLVWIPYKKVFLSVKKAVDILIRNSIDVRLYNFPLCTVDPEYWTLCKRSISDIKIRYRDTCNICRVRDACGGLFNGTLHFEKDEIKAIS